MNNDSGLEGPERASRIRGCLLGGAIGDALGGPVEFWNYQQIVDHCGPDGVREFLPATYDQISGQISGIGLITDDTQMTLFTVEGIIRGNIRVHLRGIGDGGGAIAHAYQRWYTTQTFPAPPEDLDELDPAMVDGWLGREQWLYSRRTPGLTCMTALESVRSESFGAPVSNNSKGCGTVMRSAPFGLVKTDNPGPPAIRASEMTHGHHAASESAGALAVLIHEIMNRSTLVDAVKTTHEWVASGASKKHSNKETERALIAAMEAAKNSEPSARTIASLGEGWIAEEALAIAVYCALVYPAAHQILDALALAVTHAGDSDSTGAICGNILGALHGEQGLPQALVNNVEGANTIRAIANDLTAITENPAIIYTDMTEPNPQLDQTWWERYPGW